MLEEKFVKEILNGIHIPARISELSHGFYRYPARFSPFFARGIIKAFTTPGDLVLDPFMGGGTTLVEACALGRNAIGVDISSLATFVSRVKTLSLSEHDFDCLEKWLKALPEILNIRENVEKIEETHCSQYQINLHKRSTWRIRKLIELSLSTTHDLPTNYLQDFARCIILSTAQWALDCRKTIPCTNEFRDHLLTNFIRMNTGAKQFSIAVRKSKPVANAKRKYQAICLQRSTAGIENMNLFSKNSPKLILTSPPYPGIHVLYHRWQIQSRRETPAPFWIANREDGTGSSHYTFGDRKQKNLPLYYDNLFRCFSSLAKICASNTLIVQVIGFSDSKWQLPQYLDVLNLAGFQEIKYPSLANDEDKRLWRKIPNRKWYAEKEKNRASGKEVVLFHKIY